MAKHEIKDEGRIEVTLTPGDEAIGKFDAKGKIEWPKTDVLGRPYNRVGAATRGITADNKQFVVIPAGMDHLIDLLGVDPAPTVEDVTGATATEIRTVNGVDVAVPKGKR